MLDKSRIGFIGGGNMAEALIKGLISSSLVEGSKMVVSDVREERLRFLTSCYGVQTTTRNHDVVSQSDILILAIKPQIFKEVLDEITPQLTEKHLLVSLAAGISTAVIETVTKHRAPVVRVMPNTPALVQSGATALCGGKDCRREDLEKVNAIFEAVGVSIIVEEYQLNAVTGLSGSGPAYFFLIIDALCDAGVKVGLARYQALELAVQTVFGSAKLLMETGKHPGILKDMVTSPGGTAIAGLHTLESGGLRRTLIDAVENATQRSEALGKEMEQLLLSKRDDH